MNKKQFQLLSINMTAIAGKLFSKAARDLLSGLSADVDVDTLNSTIADVCELDGGDDVEAMLVEAYISLDETSKNIDYAYNKLDESKLGSIISKVDLGGADLFSEITASDFSTCLKLLENEENRLHFDVLNQYLGELFDDPSSDLIAKALFSEDIGVLVDNSDKINSSSITMENLETAVLYELTDIFKWLVERYSPSTEETLSLLDEAVASPEYFGFMLRTLNPGEDELSAVVDRFENIVPIASCIKTYQWQER